MMCCAALVAVVTPAPAYAVDPVWRPHAIQTAGVQFTPTQHRGGNSFSNNGRYVAGTSTSATTTQAAVYDVIARKVRLLGPVVGMDSSAVDVNDTGNAVGYVTVNGQRHVFFVPNHSVVFRDLGTLGGVALTVSAINNSDVIVGTWSGGSPVRNHAYRWDRAVRKLQLLTADPLDRPSGAYAINSAGVVVGFVDDGFGLLSAVWNPVTSPPTLISESVEENINALDLNDQGVVVGDFALDRSTRAVFTYAIETLKFATLPSTEPPPGRESASATTITRTGAVLGTINRATIWNDCGRAFTSLGVSAVGVPYASTVYGMDITGAIWTDFNHSPTAIQTVRWTRTPRCT